MRCLSIRQPYAALIVAGLKTIETRSWETSYRGNILIHAGLGSAAIQSDFMSLVSMLDPELADVRGCLIGAVVLRECRELTPSDRPRALCDVTASGRYAWVLESPQRFRTPIPMRGKLGLFNAEKAISPELHTVLRNEFDGFDTVI